MEKDVKIKIELSKSKMKLTLMGAVAFVAIGFWLITNPPSGSSNIFKNETVTQILGVISILFFGAIAISIARKLSDSKPGLQIDSLGITDNSSAVSAGLIPWNDITAVEIAQVMNQQFLLIIVRNPEDYINQITNPIKKGAVKMNYQSYGSPISISANALQIDFTELYQIVAQQFQHYKV